MARPDSTYPLVIKPYKLDLTQFGDKVRDEIEFKIENVSDMPVEVMLISSAPRFFTLELPSQIGAGSTATGKLKLAPEAVDQRFEKSFTIECNDEQKTRFTVPVKRSIRPAVNNVQAKGASGK